jgi:hypothetical protein
MKRVVIESPLAGDAPYASHLLFDQEGVLNDLLPAERELGITAGFAWGEVADLTAVYVDRGISDGMRRGIASAENQSRPVEFRSLHASKRLKQGNYERRRLR